MGKANPKRLLVEGKDDLLSVAELIGARIDWPDESANAPVHIVDCKGVENLLEQFFISGNLKEHAIQALGVMLDADEGCEGRWQSIRSECENLVPELPIKLPPEGFIAKTNGGKTFGVWIMPDNLKPGSLETFLQELVPDQQVPLWLHAVKSVEDAKVHGLPTTPAHLDKAQLYTWLAWQEPPGQLCGRALTQKILDPKSPSAEPFVTWFRMLFQL